MAPQYADIQRHVPRRLLAPALALLTTATTLFEDFLELGIGEFDERNDKIGLDIAIVLAVCYVAALVANVVYIHQQRRAAATTPGARGPTRARVATGRRA